MNLDSSYTGRFAPSPTGSLHFGSLVAATASYLDARAAGGRWLVRMEDVDTLRSKPGAAAEILKTLEQFGFEWDGPVMVQSERTEAYRAEFDRLRKRGLVYPCVCTRREIGGDRYRGTCRGGAARSRSKCSWRLTVEPRDILFEDRVQGKQAENVSVQVGDFVILRADGLFAYQLAVVIDDRDQGVTHVVRGADLLDSTARQIYLQRLLSAPTPAYLHTPVALNSSGQKLSKQTLARPVDRGQRLETLMDVLRFLRQPAPAAPVTLNDLWKWSIANWRPELLPHCEGLEAPTRYQ
jgi:glutamyl-Q tRNA(Asp) synthetase